MLRLNKTAKVTLFIVLIVYFFVVATPFGVLFLNSFKSMREIYLKPFAITESFSLDNYKQAWEKAQLGSAYMNSLIVSITSIGGVLLFSSMLAFMISRYRFKFRRFIYVYIITGLALPARLAVIPIYVTLNQLNLIDTRIGLIMVYIATGTAFATFIIKGFMDSIPIEIEESARMDGATPWIIYWKIALPLTKPALVVVGLVNFVNVWNDFFFPLIILSSRSKETVPLAISVFFGEFSNQWHLIAAALSMSIIPIMLIFFLFSKNFISGITQGAIK
ncbi:MAG: raffinose/stachyose/melibiose transport system permease protein [Thermotogaceae bacterium]|jgi:raffinose/stachyose/melibiose transport system permease protein|nr:raffinose/stachyose/melibiose transport system permease protein [Thermotogaceae bacterium]